MAQPIARHCIQVGIGYRISSESARASGAADSEGGGSSRARRFKKCRFTLGRFVFFMTPIHNCAWNGSGAPIWPLRCIMFHSITNTIRGHPVCEVWGLRFLFGFALVQMNTKQRESQAYSKRANQRTKHIEYMQYEQGTAPP